MINLLVAKVRHSQSVTAPQLHCWIVATNSGQILCSHCTCMAGLGEACSHVSALLFSAETHNRLQRDTSACTSQLCAWLPPSTKNVPFAPISDIDFTSPITKRKRIMTGFASKNRQTKVSVPPPSQAEISNFFSNLAKTGKPALLSTDPEYSDAYVLDYDLLSSPLSTCFTEENMSLSFDDLLSKCGEIFNCIPVTESQAKRIECMTRDQAHSKLWFSY